MKIELDFDTKTIRVKDNVPIGSLIEKLRGLELGNWEEWVIVAQEIEYIPNIPYIPYPTPWPIYPTYPTYPITWETTTGIVSGDSICGTLTN